MLIGIDVEKYIVKANNQCQLFFGAEEEVKQDYLIQLSFPSDDAVKKTVYLSLMEIEKKGTQPIHNWGLTAQQLAILFPARFKILA